MQEIEIEVARVMIKDVGTEACIFIQDAAGTLYQGRDVLRKTGDGYFTQDAITAYLIAPGDRIKASVSQVKHGFGGAQMANNIWALTFADPLPDARPSVSRMRGHV